MLSPGEQNIYKGECPKRTLPFLCKFMETYYTYIIQSETTGKFYIGYTSDLEARISQHNDPLNSKRKTTAKNNGPWILVHSESFNSKTEAIKREKQIKSWKSRKAIEKLIALSSVESR